MNKKVWRVFVVIVLLLAIYFIPGVRNVGDDGVSTRHKIRFAAEHEFIVRPDGLSALQEAYDFTFDEVYEMLIGLTHEALRAGDVDAALGFTTDAKIAEYDLVALEDDLGFFPVYHGAPVIRQEMLAQHPDIEPIMAGIASRLDNDAMVFLNYQADIEEVELDDLARQWLRESGLLAGEPRLEQSGEPVIVGSNEFAEQEILGKITVAALQHAGIPVIDRTQYRGLESNRSAIQEGLIHLYWACTGAQIYRYFGDDALYGEPEQILAHVSQRDAVYGLVWLQPAPFVNALALLMRAEDAQERNIFSISDLAAWIRTVQTDTVIRR